LPDVEIGLCNEAAISMLKVPMKDSKKLTAKATGGNKGQKGAKRGKKGQKGAKRGKKGV